LVVRPRKAYNRHMLVKQGKKKRTSPVRPVV
jgi:hypothetical protein